jgi:hypothetical protein
VDTNRRQELLTEIARLDETKRRIAAELQPYVAEEQEIRDRVEQNLKPHLVKAAFTFSFLSFLLPFLG